MKKLDSRSRVKKKSARRPNTSRAGRDTELWQRFEDLIEQFDLVMPEVTARVAALEHLLREKQLVTRQDLVSARAFVRLQEE
jgi:Holliday junction resolvasome RuvABC endonuclease subunit